MKDLKDIRDTIDKIDDEIISLLEKRLSIVCDVAEYKIANHMPVLDRKRELEKIEKLSRLINDEFSRQCLKELFLQIMSMSRKKQYQLLHQTNWELEKDPFQEVEKLVHGTIKVVFQGVAGAYSQMAMHTYFGTEIQSEGVASWRDAMEAVSQGQADFAVLPIENSSAGIVSENYDLLVEYNNYIVGEQTIAIEHALLGLPEADISQITTVYSHPQALMQCVDFLDEYKRWQRIRMTNTAVAAEKVKADGDKTQAAIANPITAQLYGLKVLKTAINYSESNSTRFIICSARKIRRKGAKKISICFEVPHESGTLYQMLSHMIFNNLNMNKIESRPIKDKSFEYRFFVDFEGSLLDGAVKNALIGLNEEALNLKILGNY
jgi:chorismate mutase/prephenate dehydratase